MRQYTQDTPNLFTYAGQLYIAYPDSNSNLVVCTLQPGGSWSEPKVIGSHAGEGGFAVQLRDTVFLYYPGENEITIRCVSSGDGTDWTDHGVISVKNFAYNTPQLVQKQNSLYMFSGGSSGTFFSASSDGLKWKSSDILDLPPTDVFAFYSEGNLFYLAYNGDSGNPGLVLASSKDGNFWNPVPSINPPQVAAALSAVSTQKQLTLAYVQSSGELMTCVSTQPGVWEEPVDTGVVLMNTGTSICVLPDGNLAIAYRDNSSFEIKYLLSTDDGASWQPWQIPVALHALATVS
jgi:hypothetical protein